MHSKKRKLFLSACLILSSVAFLSGCDSSSENSGGGNTSEEITTWYTVSLNPNGGTFSDGTTDTKVIQVGENHAIDFSQYDVTYEGNVLYGWYYENGSPWPGARKVTEDVSLVAKWNVAAEEVEVGLDIWDANGTHLTIREDGGIYQFSRSSSIYYGYATRTATYTIRHDDLVNAIENVETDGKAQCVIHAEGSYYDATGSCYAEFFNDGTVELFYDYTYGGSRSKYSMESFYYSVEGVTFPYEAPSELAESGTSTHYADNDEAIAGGPGCNTGDDSGNTGGDTGGGETTSLLQSYVLGDVIYTASATNSETMSAAFYDNGYISIQYSGYNAGYYFTYSYSAESDLTITAVSDGSAVTVSEDTAGTYTFSDGIGNTYSISESELAEAIPEASTLIDINATVSTTMLLRFYDNHTYSVLYYYADYATYVAIGVNGTWNYSADNGFEMGGASGTLTQADDGTYTYNDGMGNDYEFTASQITGEETATSLLQSYVLGDVIYSASATNSQTMTAAFYDNGYIAIQYSGYNAGYYFTYSYSADADLTITAVSDGSAVTVSEDTAGTYTFSDGIGNTYSISESELAEAIPEASTLIDINATVSTTMLLRFYDNHTYSVLYYYADYATYVAIGVNGTWNYSADNGFEMGGASGTLTQADDGTYTYNDGMGNDYNFTASDIATAINSAA